MGTFCWPWPFSHCHSPIGIFNEQGEDERLWLKFIFLFFYKNDGIEGDNNA